MGRRGLWAVLLCVGVVGGSWMVAWGQVPPEQGAGGRGEPSMGPGSGQVEPRGSRDGMSLRMNMMGQEREARMGGSEGRPLQGPGDRQRMSEEEQARLRVFVNSYMPNLDAAMQEIRLPRQRIWLMGMAKFQYQRYERGRRDFPELEESLRQDIRNIDEMVRLAREFPSASESQQGAIRVELRERMKSVATNMIMERRKRIEKLRAQLEREERGLSIDEKGLEGVVDTRMEELLRFGLRSVEAGGGGARPESNEPVSKPSAPSTKPSGPG